MDCVYIVHVGVYVVFVFWCCEPLLWLVCAYECGVCGACGDLWSESSVF